MSQRNKSLLEAFKASGPTKPLSSGGPANPALPSSPAIRPSLLGSGPPRGGVTLRPAQLQLVLLAQLLLLVVAFLLGRSSGRSALASNTDGASQDAVSKAAAAPVLESSAPGISTPRPVVEAPPVAPAPTDAQVQVDPHPRNAAEQALLDKNNVYTIKLVEYANTETNRKLAQDALRYLTEQSGLPACLAGTGTRLYILVGAAPKQVDFDELLKLVKQMKGPPPMSKSGEFHDAYLEKIDKVFKRK